MYITMVADHETLFMNLKLHNYSNSKQPYYLSICGCHYRGIEIISHFKRLIQSFSLIRSTSEHRDSTEVEINEKRQKTFSNFSEYLCNDLAGVVINSVSFFVSTVSTIPGTRLFILTNSI